MMRCAVPRSWDHDSVGPERRREERPAADVYQTGSPPAVQNEKFRAALQTNYRRPVIEGASRRGRQRSKDDTA